MVSARKALQYPNTPWLTRLHLLSALGHLGRDEEAAKALAELLEVQPACTISFFMQRAPYTDNASCDHQLEGLRKAGMPE